jgi:hypothetical protein
MVSMGNWKKVLAKCFFVMLPSAATPMQYDVHHIFPSLACIKIESCSTSQVVSWHAK